jgi:hypothetical protein
VSAIRSAGIVVDLFCDGKVIPQLQEVNILFHLGYLLYYRSVSNDG